MKQKSNDKAKRQPVHSVYGGAQLFNADTIPKLGALAQKFFKEFAPDAPALFEAIGVSITEEFAKKIYSRVEEKLKREAIEDFRIDFEDGYGYRTDKEEDSHAKDAAQQLAIAVNSEKASPFVGFRIKPLSRPSAKRANRTLEIFLSTFVSGLQKDFPENFLITIPKVKSSKEIKVFISTLKRLEKKLKIKPLSIEMMIETPESLISGGRIVLREIIEAAEGRCQGAHFGVYDYTSALQITAAHQSMTHPACDFAKNLMQVSLANTGVHLVDGATNNLPVPPHRSGEKLLTPTQVSENRSTVHRAWKLGFENIIHSLRGGFYQGWDLHPSQFPIRYVATYCFFLEALEAASKRLKAFLEASKQASLSGSVFDDAASARGLMNFFERGMYSGALVENDLKKVGLNWSEIQKFKF